MTECTRCGTDTTRNALTSEADVGNAENGVVWLCDNCMSDFNEFLGEQSRLSEERLEELQKEAYYQGFEEADKELRED